MANSKIGIIVSTNRKDAFSAKVGQYYAKAIENKGIETEILNLANLPEDFAFSALYHNSGKNEAFNEFQKKIDSYQKIVFIVPEYNGSYPGILKTFIDGLRHPNSLAHKKICLVGLSAGVLGNAVGLSHLSDVLSYLNANILGLRIKLGMADKNFIDGEITNETYKNFIAKQIEYFLAF